MKKLIDSIKYIKFNDLFCPFIFIICLIPSLLFRVYLLITKKELWLVSEQKDTARDNGFYFYKYVRTKHKNEYCFYAINKKCNDYIKVKKYGNIIQYGSIKHWIFYMSSKFNISNHKNGNPNEKFWYVVHVIFNMYNNRVFLQHGVIKDDIPAFYHKNSKFKYFVTSAKKEYDYIIHNYGYSKESIIYTGLPRFDSLHNIKSDKKKILIMPTWRNWLGREYNLLYKSVDFKETTYFRMWNSIINNKKLINYLEKKDINLYFYPHINMKKYLGNFKTKSNNIKILNYDYDIQTILKETSLLITDYSSVYMDYAYMKKPVVFYQFDYDEYRKKQLQPGYFDYINDGFGDVYCHENEVINKIFYYIDNDYRIENKYLDRMFNFFELNDKKNSERIFNILRENRQ